MKRFLLLSTLLCFTSMVTFGQTTWTGAGANTNWNETDNWDTNIIPTVSDDVIIPTGFTVTLNVAGTIKSINVQGNAVFDMNFNLTFIEPSTLGADTSVNWSDGILNGTGSTLNNLGTINLTTTALHNINGGTTLDNQGVLNLTSSGDLVFNTGSILNNPVGGIIDMQADSGDIRQFSGQNSVLNNAGLIKKSTSAGEAQIHIPINNNDGTIQVEVGTLSFQNSLGKNLNDGTYNVFAGATMDWDTTINPSGTLEGTIVGDLNWNNIVNVVDGTFAAFNFSASDNFNWTSGSLSGGGTLTNTNVLKSTTTSVHNINGGTTIDNQGVLNLTSSGDLVFNTGSILNNPVGGIIDMQADSGDIRQFSGQNSVLINAGLIKKTTSSGEAQIQIPINNNDGTIQVEVGILSFQNSLGKNLNDGTYNVFAGATMDWDTTINPSGTLEGTIVGDLNWNNIVNVVDGTFAAFNFSASDNFNWTSGTLSGGGTLTNTNVLKSTTASAHNINGGTTLDNQGILNITSAGDLIVNQGSIINNSVGGIIDMQADSGNIRQFSGTGSLFNAGLIKKSITTGLAQISLELNNSGIIEVVSGELEITSSVPFTNEVTGIVKGVGIFDLPTVANYTNNGTFAPGLSPGTLSVQGDYTSTATSVLDVELDGLTPDTEYDVLAITGTNVVFEGDVNVTLGFDANVGDSFTIATVSGTIATKNLITPIYADFGCKQFTFDVTYPSDKDVLLTISAKEDVEPPVAVTQDITVQLDASGNASITTSQINDGSSDNCTLEANLILALNTTVFTCADLGPNTVMLTVTDEAGLSANANATVIVEDTVLPTVVTQNIMVELDAAGNASITPAEIDNGSSDNCTVSNLSLDTTAFTCANLGTNTVNLTVTDQSANSDSAPATVTVEDSINPSISCPVDFIVDSTGDYTLPDYFGNATVTSSDNCTINNSVQTPIAGTILTDGDHIIDFIVTDQSGNSNMCSFTLTVNDENLSVDSFELSNNDILLFPNPVVDKVTIRNFKNLELLDAILIDVKGSIINRIDLKGMTIDKEISLEHFASGMYFIRINSINGSIVKRLIKQ